MSEVRVIRIWHVSQSPQMGGSAESGGHKLRPGIANLLPHLARLASCHEDIS